jgi:hypothetical protein
VDKSQESQKGLRGVIGISFISRVTDMMGRPMDPTKEQEGGWLHCGPFGIRQWPPILGEKDSQEEI